MRLTTVGAHSYSTMKGDSENTDHENYKVALPVPTVHVLLILNMLH